MGFNNNKITPVQFMLVLIQAQIGVSVLALPHDIYRFAKGSSWITVIGTGLLFQIVILLFWFLLKRHESVDFFQLTKQLTGKYIGTFINLVYIAFGLVVTGLASYNFFYILRRWAYPLTPKWIFICLFMFTVGYLAKNKIQAIARFATVTIIPLPILLIILLIVTIQIGRVVYLFPLWGSTKTIEFIHSFRGALGAFIGLELILYIYPQVSGTHKQKLKWMSIANFSVTVFYLFIMVISLCIFSSLERIPEPVLYIVKALSLPVIERIDLIFLSLWVVTSVCAVAFPIFGASLGLRNVLRKKEQEHYRVTWIVVLLAFVLALLCEWIIKKNIYVFAIDYLSLLVYLVLPFILLVVSLMKRKGTAKS